MSDTEWTSERHQQARQISEDSLRTHPKCTRQTLGDALDEIERLRHVLESIALHMPLTIRALKVMERIAKDSTPEPYPEPYRDEPEDVR